MTSFHSLLIADISVHQRFSVVMQHSIAKNCTYIVLLLNQLFHAFYSIVPFCLHGDGFKYQTLPNSYNPSLADVAPTVLDIMGLDIPGEMTGKSLLLK